MISGAQAMLQSLLQEQVSVIFGYPGAAIAPFYSCLPNSGIRHILTRNEQSAGHAASGYARITGKPGVCVATSGPGATNMFTAIATAYSDSIPLVAITGQVESTLLGRDVFQEVDTTGAVEPFSKYTYLVQSASEIGRVFKEAFHIASTGRSGPVLLDIPVDVQLQMTRFDYPKKVQIRGYQPNYTGHPLQIRKVSHALQGAKRPLICCGGGVLLSGAQTALQEFSTQNSLPVVTTMMGIGSIPVNHPNCIGMLGNSGCQTANDAIRQSDLLLLISARVGERAIQNPDALGQDKTIIHIDIDTAEIGKNLGTTIPVVGDANTILHQLLEETLVCQWADWTAQLQKQAGQERQQLSKTAESTQYVEPNQFVRTLCAHLPEESIYVADVGQNQLWSARNFSANCRFLTTGGMGTMGYAIPAAIGAKLAQPDKLVLAVCGDGAFQMSMQELATIRQHNIPIKIVVMRNGKLGLVRELQLQDGGPEFAVDLTGSPDLQYIAKAYAIPYRLVCSNREAEAAMVEMLQTDGAYLLDCVIDEHVGAIAK